MVNISKSTPYVRYRENISSSLHLGTIHVKSEYLDRTKPTTIESIHGMTWHNRIFNQNRELPLLSNESITLTDKHREYYDTGEKRVPIDIITANENCVANEDGTYTYEVRSYESDYQESYDGVNYFKVESKQLHGEMEITYNTNEEDILGSLIIDDTMSGKNQIENSKDGVLERATINGKTLVNNVLDDSKNTEYIVLGEGINTSESMASVSGTIEGEAKDVVLKGQTLVNKTTIKRNGFINTVHTTLFDSSVIEPNKRYYIRIKNNGTETLKLYGYLPGYTEITLNINEEKILTPTFGSTINPNIITVHQAQTQPQNLDGMIIEYQEGMENWDIPYFEGMQSVRMPVLKSVGKNLFDGTVIKSSINVETGEIFPNENSLWSTTNYINVKNINSLYFQTSQLSNMNVVYMCFDENKNFIGHKGFYDSLTGIITPLNNTHYIRLRLPSDIDVSTTQIEQGTQPTSYEPYKSNTLSTPSDLELRGIGDVQDTLDVATGTLTQRIGEVIFDGSEDWQTHDTTTTNTVRYYLGDAVQNAKPLSEDDGVCDKIPYRRIHGVDEVGVTLTKASGHCYLRSTIRDLSEFKTWLQSNPITVQYQLATPVTKAVDLSCVDQDGVTQSNRVKTYDTTTHFQLSSYTLTPNLSIPSALEYNAMVLPSKQYTLRVDRPTSGECSVDVGGTLVTLQDGEQIKTFNTLNTLSHNKVKFTTVGQKVNEVMLLEGNEQGDISYFTGMQSVRMPVLTTTGKNLFDKTKLSGGEFATFNGKSVYRYTDGETNFKYHSKFKENTRYTFTGKIYRDDENNSMKVNFNFYYTDGTRTANNVDQGSIFTITSSKNKTIDYISGSHNFDRSAYLDLEIAQLEEGSTSTPYEPFKSNILSTPNDLELRGIGDVQDILDVNSREVMEYIGEIVLDGSEVWKCEEDTRTYYTNLGDLGVELNPYANTVLCDKFVYYSTHPSVGGCALGGAIGSRNGNLLINYDELSGGVENFKNYLQQNPITVQYQLANPVTKAVDLEILNQDGDNVRNFKTYGSVTHITTSSDELIPSVQVDFKVASSVETVTGHDIKVENGERADLISCKLYGETLQNVLPKPSLKNSMSNMNIMQKLNEGYDNVNVIDGVAKSAILKGCTLVNLAGFKTFTYQNASTTSIGDRNKFKTNTKYTFIYKVTESVNVTGLYLDSMTSSAPIPTTVGLHKITQTTKSDISTGNFAIYATGSNKILTIDDFMIIEGDYTDIDVPYFEGMQSVRMPVLTTTGKNLFDGEVEGGSFDNWGNKTDSYDSKRSINLIEVKPNTKYKIVKPFTDWHSIIGFKENDFSKPINDSIGSHAVIDSSTSQIQEFTTSPTTKFLALVCVNSIDISQTMIVAGSETNYTFEPHKSNILSTPSDLELRGIGDVQDELNLLTGELTQHIEEVVLDGSENWDAADNLYFITIDKRVMNNTAISNYLQPQNFVHFFENSELIGVSCQDLETYSRIYVRINANYTKEETIQYLQQNPLTVQYELATESIKTVDLSSYGSWDKVVLDGSQKLNEYSGNIPYYGISVPNILPFRQGGIAVANKVLKSSSTGISSNKYSVVPANTTNVLCFRLDYGTTKEEVNQYLSENPITVWYQATTTQENSITEMLSFSNGHIQLSSEVGSLIPRLDYEVPTNNSYYLDIVKTDTQYTSKCSSDCNATIDGETIALNSNGTFTTPSTITDKLMVLDTPVNDLMFIEGDITDRELSYFEGLVGVEEPIIHIHSDNLMGGAIIPQHYGDYTFISDDSRNYAKTRTPFLKLKPNTKYCSLVEAEVDAKTQVVFNLFDITNNKLIDSNCNNTTIETKTFSHRAIFITDGTGELYLGGYPFGSEDNFKIWLKHMNRAKWLIWENGTLGSSATQPYIEALGTKLQPLQPIALHSIGDIKDEIDFTNDTITRRIGRVVLDGSENWSIYDTYSNQYRTDFIIRRGDLPTGCVLISNRYEGAKNRKDDDTQTNYIHVGTTNINVFASPNISLEEFKSQLQANPLEVLYVLETPVIEHINLVKPNNNSSIASLTLSSPLSIGDTIRWNPYQEHYARYNVDGTHEILDLTDRQFIELYDRKTIVTQDYDNKVQSQGSTGTILYCLLEPNTEFDVIARFPESPDGDVKVNLGGTIGTMEIINSIGRVHITTPSALQNNLCTIYSGGIKATVTDVMVFKHIGQSEELFDLDYCSGINGIGEIVNVDGVNKAKVIVEQTNGNLIDVPCEITNNGNHIKYVNIKVKPNTAYVLKVGECELGKNIGVSIVQRGKNGESLPSMSTIGSAANSTGAMFTTYPEAKTLEVYRQISDKGSGHQYVPIELVLKEISEDGVIRPRNHNEFEFILPIQLHRINAIYDNLYYDELKGYYRIQQSIGHKFFTGADNESWTLISNGDRVMKFRYNNADIQLKQQGEYTTNLLPVTETDNYDSCYFNGTNFTVTITKERLNSETLSGFKEWLRNNNLHLMYQLITPLMHELPQYKGRVELATYQDEIYTFLKNCLNTEFTLGVATDKTYRWHELEESQGYMNRITSSDERLTKEDALYINHIEGKGIANLIEDTNNVPTLLKPNYSGKATSHQLANSKQSTIKVHGFEPNGGTCGTWNNDTNMYELKVMSGDSSYINTNSDVLNIPYQLETYEDGTCDRVEYNEVNKVWQITGGTTRAIAFNSSSGQFTNQVELFRGMAPRTGLFAEMKVRFNSGTTSARMYFSLDGANFSSTILRAMSDDVDYYIGFFNTGGTKIDYAIKYSAESEYTNMVALSPTIPKALIINQIQNINECTQYVDKTYYYDSSVLPLELDTYNGTTNIYMYGKATDTNIIIHNIGLHKQCLTYTDETYTVYWKYLGGEGNITITLGGTTVSVDGQQEYVTLKTAVDGLQDTLIVGGYNLSVQDLMLVKGAKIDDLAYFEGSRQVGTLYVDEDGNPILDDNGNRQYKISLVSGTDLVQDAFEDSITFEDTKKHNVLVTKLLGETLEKLD